nr:AKR_HP1_G0022350.mRNA.1.CDS.1 [Saccharomyces cerevisiae]
MDPCQRQLPETPCEPKHCLIRKVTGGRCITLVPVFCMASMEAHTTIRLPILATILIEIVHLVDSVVPANSTTHHNS